MPIIPVESLLDSQLAPYRDLPKSNPTALSGRFVVEGKLLVDRLVASNYPVESIVVEENRLGMLPSQLSPDIPVYLLPQRAVEQLIGFNFHRGILGCGRRIPLRSIDEVMLTGKRELCLVACVDVQDPTNLGGILRNCAAFGADGVLLSHRCADVFSRRVLRVSMGTAFQLRMFVSSDLLTDLCRVRDEQQVVLVAAVLDPTAAHLEQSPRSPRMALLIGNEGQGLTKDWLDVCQQRVTLPMDHGTDSLNAAAASAVFLYHFTRVAGGGKRGSATSSS